MTTTQTETPKGTGEPLRRDIEFLIFKDNILNSNKQLHRFVKSKNVKFLRELAFNKGEEIKLLEGDKFRTFEKFKVTVLVAPPTRVRIDPPNLYPTVKPLIDGFTDAGFWEDDNFRYLLDTSFRYDGLSGEKGYYRVRLIIEEMTDTSGYITDI